MEHTTLYYSIFIGFVIFPIFCLLLILRGLQLTLKKTDFSIQKQSRILLQTSLVFMFWLLLTGGLAYFGFLEMNEQKPIIPPPLLVLVNIPLITLLLFVNFNKTLKQILKVVPLHWLIYFQSFRIGVEVLIWVAFIQNLLPIQMTFEGYNSDILVGIFALPVGYFVVKQTSINSNYLNTRAKKKMLIAWNIFGLCLLATIVIISVLSAPLPIRYFMNEPSSKIVAFFPFVWLPTVLVVIAYSLHILSLKQAFLMKKDFYKE